MNFIMNITYKLGQFTRIIIDRNKNCIDRLYTFRDSVSSSVTAGYNDNGKVNIKTNTYFNSDDLNENLIVSNVNDNNDNDTIINVNDNNDNISINANNSIYSDCYGDDEIYERSII